MLLPDFVDDDDDVRRGSCLLASSTCEGDSRSIMVDFSDDCACLRGVRLTLERIFDFGEQPEVNRVFEPGRNVTVDVCFGLIVVVVAAGAIRFDAVVRDRVDRPRLRTVAAAERL